MNINYKTIENQVKKSEYRLKFPKRTKCQRKIENAQFPSFISSFYDSIQQRNTLPSQKEFYLDYINNHLNEHIYNVGKNKLLLKDFNRYQRGALRTRLYKRVYPSLVREVHCNLLLNETTIYNVHSSIKTDVKDGIDSIINNKYAVHFWFVTKNSMKWRKKKKDYRHDYDNSGYINIELPLDPFKIINNKMKGKELGDFFLYSYNEVEYLVDKIHKAETKAV